MLPAMLQWGDSNTHPERESIMDYETYFEAMQAADIQLLVMVDRANDMIGNTAHRIALVQAREDYAHAILAATATLNDSALAL